MSLKSEKSTASLNRRERPQSMKAAAEEENSKGAEVKQRPVERMKSNRIGEVAGGTAGKCAAVCCCCPFALMNMLVLVVYKVPAGVCRKMWRKRKLRQRKKDALLQRTSPDPSLSVGEESDVEMIEKKGGGGGGTGTGTGTDAVDIESEMWARFDGAGFWRSSSQRGSSKEVCNAPTGVIVSNA